MITGGIALGLKIVKDVIIANFQLNEPTVYVWKGEQNCDSKKWN